MMCICDALCGCKAVAAAVSLGGMSVFQSKTLFVCCFALIGDQLVRVCVCSFW
jgi:hypothetical protein